MAIDFHRVEEAFQAVLTNPCGSRETALDAACGGDTALRAEVVVLLASHENAADFLSRPVTENLAVELSSGHEVEDLTQWLSQRSLDETPPGAESGSQSGNSQPGHPRAGNSHIGNPDTIAGHSNMATYEAPESPLPVTSGGMLGEFEILEVVGTGGMGIVVKARDTQLDRIVALKIMKPFLASDATARTRFMQEARSAAKVIHPHVVTIHGVREAGSISYLVMEYVEGQTLDQRIAAGPLDAAEIVRISRQAALGLAAAHKRGIIHRDIKPANILLLSESLADEAGQPCEQPCDHQVKISDFGLARIMAGGALTQSGVIIGTPQYMSPEQALGEPLDQRSDLFSLGSVMYAMCTGQAAFQAESIMGIMRRVSDKPHAPIASLNPQTPEWLIAIVDRLLAKLPDDRIQSAGELAQLLERQTAPARPEPAPAPVVHPAVDGPASSLPAAPQPLPQTRRLRSRALKLGLLLAPVVLAAAVFVITTKDGQFELTTDDPQITAMLGEQGGIWVEDRTTGRKYLLKRGANRLAAGNYDLVVTTPDGVELETPKFQITRFGKPVATAIARSVRDVAAVKPAEPASVNSIAPPAAEKATAAAGKLPTVPDDEWAEPVNLGRPVNSPGYDSGAHLSADGLTLLFQSPRNRDVRTGPLQLWQSKRSSPHEPFAEPERLGDALNGTFVCVDPSQTADGLVLAFGSERPDGHGGADIWMSVRDSADQPWPAPFCLSPEINSARAEWEPEISPDGLTLYFHSDRHEGYGGTDIWVSRRESRDRPWAAAVNLGPGVNTPDNEGGAALAADGLTLVFHRVVPGHVSLFRASRATADAEFSDAQPLLPDSFTDGTASSAGISADGNELYFTMARAAGQGGPDLWVSRRVKKLQADLSNGARPNDWALKLDRGSYVEMATLPLDPNSPQTLEAFVTYQGAPDGQNKHVFGWASPNSLFLRDADASWAFGIARSGGFQCITSPNPATPGKRAHLALVRTVQEMRLYIDGRLAAATDERATPMLSAELARGPFSISINWADHEFLGVVDELRVSTAARYDKEFAPQPRFEPDADTLALYHIDEGQGDVLHDASGHEHHGKIVGARWVRAN